MPQYNYMVTGANAGLGLEAGRQLALRDDTATVFLACRSAARAKAAIESLLETADNNYSRARLRDKLTFIHFDASATKEEIEYSMTQKLHHGNQLHGVVLNAGGSLAGRNATIMNIVQVNVIGHLRLLELLERKNILARKQGDTVGCRIIFSGSESARGIPMFLSPIPQLGDSVDFYDRLIRTGNNLDPATLYGATKGLATLYFAEYARRHPDYKVLTVSPGGTLGTNALENLPWIFQCIVRLLWTIAYYCGRFQELEAGAKKYVDAVTGACDNYPSGTFLACSVDLAGSLCNQAQFKCAEQYSDTKKQKAAFQALQKYM